MGPNISSPFRRCRVAELPPELLWVVFSFLEFSDFPSVDGSCSLFHSVFQNQNFWRLLAIQRFQFLSDVVDPENQPFGRLVDPDDPMLLSPFYVQHFGSWRECVQSVKFLTEGSDAWLLPNEAVMKDTERFEGEEEDGEIFLKILSHDHQRMSSGRKKRRRKRGQITNPARVSIDSQIVYSELEFAPLLNGVPHLTMGFRVRFTHDPDLKMLVASAENEKEEGGDDDLIHGSVCELYHHLGLAKSRSGRYYRGGSLHGVFKMVVDGIDEVTCKSRGPVLLNSHSRVPGCLHVKTSLEKVDFVARPQLRSWFPGKPIGGTMFVFDLCEVSSLAWLQDQLLDMMRSSPMAVWDGPCVLVGANARHYLRGPLDYKCVTMKDVRDFQAKLANPSVGLGMVVPFAGSFLDECKDDDAEAKERCLHILKVMLKATVLCSATDVEKAFHPSARV